jgi:hypothetical protein
LVTLSLVDEFSSATLKPSPGIKILESTMSATAKQAAWNVTMIRSPLELVRKSADAIADEEGVPRSERAAARAKSASLVQSVLFALPFVAGSYPATLAQLSESYPTTLARRADIEILEYAIGSPGKQDAWNATQIRASLELAHESADAITDEEGVPPSEQAFQDAEAFIDLLPLTVPLPLVYASGDAEVGFTWSNRDRFLEVAFRGDGQLHWAAAFGSDRPGDVVRIDIRSATRLPRQLAGLIDRL